MSAVLNTPPAAAAGSADVNARLMFSKNLQNVTNKIHATNNIDEIMLEMSQDICELFNCDRLTIYVISEDKQSVVSKVKTGLNSFKDLKLPISEQSVAGYVAETRKAVNISDVYDDVELKSYSPRMQFLKEVDWGELDYLVVDMPPGTGDAQLTMIQAVPISGGIIVTTPNPVALLDAVRGVEMFRKLDVPVLGIVENMSWYDVGGVRVHPFGEGGGVKMAAEYGVALLGQVPLKDAIRSGGDTGRPAVLDGEGVFTSIAAAIERVLPR